MLAAMVLAACGWWADRSGYGTVGLALSLPAGTVVLASARRSGAPLRRPATQGLQPSAQRAVRSKLFSDYVAQVLAPMPDELPR
ncbi:hypothetical protein Snoj_29900 [Streptomyces nojiriensis]|uniref:MFS transporter n=1 Tax=Streptomyces nojiriensis TaxID=66374 RepID=A0ABQ3SLQ6_9ACTN|nr:hypothetical protein JYK04_00416 [Streptomyces nojiriensis]GGS15904.1 hypothetical protein GCM10010205_52080 [Streptomyces nojiriensis]GHI69072.1 hypothetical protein Snoj_29900 [Streptomyces nojiriensis]